MHHPPPTTPRPCPWRHYTGNVRDKRADSCSPVGRRLVCGACLEASQGRSELKVEFVGFLGNTWRTWHGWWPCNKMAGWGRRVSWRRRTAVTAHQWMVFISCWVFWLVFLWVRIRFLDEDLNFFSVRHQIHHFVQASQETNFSHFSFLFCLGGVLFAFDSWLALGRC